MINRRYWVDDPSDQLSEEEAETLREVEQDFYYEEGEILASPVRYPLLPGERRRADGSTYFKK